ncbi:helix-turn-helix domain-containing protein [Gracilibacillus salinarum]|uniref:Helix-turn-helix domain-containing protein n=1 Tax=Gracilibacillus salinarum TaxID=2932255 RepID=A0ABY4GKZ7_9BACI|nr:helix-turn-helix domain-containing protein [Gracilibacillus salinarum]UOQ84112.1 helix-turn-helix domain-containing protein [Gracilibacillus salinarum]
MVNIMLVDDEALEREGIRMILERNRSDAKIIAEARTGKQAVEQALIHQPDIIFMDIKMPEMDGLAAIETILAEIPATKCIMVSAFDTFQYAKQAMSFGIKEYLLKPSKISEVLDAYDRMVGELAERQDIDTKLEQASSLVEMEFILTLMMDHVHDFDTDEWMKGMQIEDSRVFAAVLSFESDQKHVDRTIKSEWYRIVKDHLMSQNSRILMGPFTGFQLPILVIYEDQNLAQFARDTLQVIQAHLYDCQLFIGVGSVIESIAEFPRSYEDALYALEEVHFHQTAKYQVYHEKMAEKRKGFTRMEVEKQLLEAIKTGDSQTGAQLFDRYFLSIQQQANHQLPSIRKSLEHFFIVLTRTMEGIGLDQDMQLNLERFDTSSQIKEVAKSHLQKAITLMNEWRSDGVQGLLLQAKDYIHTHFKENIMLDEVAAEVGLSSYYLSKLFKEHFQLTFVEYVTHIRLEKAKDLLLDDEMPLKEIALTIGYRDPNYFSRVFKKETGLSPSEYRKNST